MKMISFTSVAALILLAGTGCTSINSSKNDEVEVVARILSTTAQAPLSFGDHTGVQRILSSLDASEDFRFGVILDAQKQLFASYFRPDQTFVKEKIVSKVIQSVRHDQPESLVLDNGVAISIVRVEIGEETVGYVAVGKER